MGDRPGDAYPVPSMMPDRFPTAGALNDDPFLIQTAQLDTKYPQVDDLKGVGTTRRVRVPSPQPPETPGAGLGPELADLLSTSKSYQMSDDEVAVAKFLNAKGYKVAEIARLMDRGRYSVSRAVRRESARECLSRQQRRLAQDWVKASSVAAKKGLHEPAQAALEAIGAVDVPAAAGGAHGAIQVNVGVALPGAGAPTTSSE